MSAKHPIEAEELMAYLDGELTAGRASRVVSHLEKCAPCQDLSADFHGLSQRLMAWEAEAADSQIPPAIAAALEGKAHESESNKIDAHPQRNTVMRRWAWVGAFAALCLLVGVGTLYRNVGQPKAETRVAEPEPPATKTVPPRRPSEQGQASFFIGGAQASGKKRQIDKPEVYAQLQAPPSVKFPVAGPMVVHTAGITITVKDFDKARVNLDAVLRRHHGYIAELNLNTPNGGSQNFTSSLRVPASELDATIAELRNFGRVESESQNGEEVTDQYVDLQARLSNARNTEQRLTDLLRQRTGKLSDVLAVETELDRVRGEIERMEAERKNLANRVDFATINATVSEDYRAQLQVVPSSTWGQIRNAAVEGYRTMSESLIATVMFLFSYAPAILLWGAILFFPARFAWKKLRQIFGR